MEKERLSALGGRIRVKRESLALSQAELAKRSGVSRTTINRAERGVVELRLVNLFKIAAGLGVSARGLFE